MNIPEIIKVINEFRGRKFLIALVAWYLVYIGKLESFWAGVISLIYFLLDTLEKFSNKKE